MKTQLKFAALALIAAVTAFAAPTPTQAREFSLDQSHTAVYFRIQHLGMSYTYGRFNEVEGSFKVTPESASFEFTVKTASVDTGNTKRDEHLRNADFFNAPQFPVIVFKGQSVKVDGADYHVKGTLTLHGVTKEVDIVLTKMGEGKDPWGNYRIGFNCETSIKRSDYGMTKMLAAVGDQVDLMISFEGLPAKK